MKNITLALAIAVGFCATEAGAQTSTRQRRSLLGGNRPAAAQPAIALFDAQKAMPYADAVEKAKGNDPEAYYWLSYYFSKGGEVNKDGNVAWKFLLKSEELGWPEASRTMGRVHEVYSLKEGRNSYSAFSFTVDYTGCKQFENSSLTNEIATSGIESFYDKALKGGVTDATNDLARIHKKIVEAKARIEKAKEERWKAEEKKHMRDENSAKALALLPPEKLKAAAQPRSSLLGGRNRSASALETEEGKPALQESSEERALREKKEAEEKAERELWSTWPKDVHPWDTNIVKKCEEDFGVVFYGEDNDGWVIGGGKCLIEWEGDWMDGMKKFDSKGILIQAGKCKNFKEYIWMTNCAEQVTTEIRKKWAEEHGMSYEEAVRKREESVHKMNSRLRGSRPGVLGGRVRAEKDIARHAAEREKQIVEALRKVCEAEKKGE